MTDYCAVASVLPLHSAYGMTMAILLITATTTLPLIYNVQVTSQLAKTNGVGDHNTQVS